MLRTSARVKPLLAAAAVLSAVAAAGCGGSEDEEAEQRAAVRGFLSSFVQGEHREACAGLTKAARDDIARQLRSLLPAAGTESCPRVLDQVAGLYDPDALEAMADARLERAEGDAAFTGAGHRFTLTRGEPTWKISELRLAAAAPAEKVSEKSDDPELGDAAAAAPQRERLEKAGFDVVQSRVAGVEPAPSAALELPLEGGAQLTVYVYASAQEARAKAAEFEPMERKAPSRVAVARKGTTVYLAVAEEDGAQLDRAAFERAVARAEGS